MSGHKPLLTGSAARAFALRQTVADAFRQLTPIAKEQAAEELKAFAAHLGRGKRQHQSRLERLATSRMDPSTYDVFADYEDAKADRDWWISERGKW